MKATQHIVFVCTGNICRVHPGGEVGDPYYGDAQAFELALDLIEDACEGLLEFLGHAGAQR